MKVYKVTDKDMKCRGFQYELGKTAEVEGDIELCKNGLHACEMPLDVLGYYAPTGDRGAASATGLRGAASATGKYCVAMTTGFFGRVMGDIGNAIVCVERRDNGEIASILAGIVDGETLKPGVWYTVKNGQWVEV
jgi:hypothetical protein|nr:MAG TPA: hypothetical protein [Caudoviricetes sp.]